MTPHRMPMQGAPRMSWIAMTVLMPLGLTVARLVRAIGFRRVLEQRG